MKRLLIGLLSLITVIGISLIPVTHSSATATNLIANPSVETPSPTNPAIPTGWIQGGWGTNTSVFSYSSASAHTGSYGLKVQTTSYSSGDTKWYFTPVNVTAGNQYTYSDYYTGTISTEVIVQFQTAAGVLSYDDLGAAPASTTWAQYSDSFTVPAGITQLTVFHLIAGVGSLQTDDFSLSQVSIPTVSVTSPTGSSVLSGVANLVASATDSVGVQSVQFAVDGVAVGSPITTSPYQYPWNSTTVADGAHAITATVTNTGGIKATSAAVSVTVHNKLTTATNLIANPSVETPSPTNPAIPTGWIQGGWGTNTSVFSYSSASAHTGSYGLKVQTTSYSSGDTKWYFTPVNVTAGNQYTYSDYYTGTISTEVIVQFQTAAGVLSYDDLGAAPASTTWAQYSDSFTVPAGITQLTVFHLIAGVGSLQTDDFSLSQVSATAPTCATTPPTTSSNSLYPLQQVVSFTGSTIPSQWQDYGNEVQNPAGYVAGSHAVFVPGGGLQLQGYPDPISGSIGGVTGASGDINLPVASSGGFDVCFSMSAGNWQNVHLVIISWPTDNNWNEGENDIFEGNPQGMGINVHEIGSSPATNVYQGSWPSALATGTHDISARWDPINGYRFYLDGTLAATAPVSSSVTTPTTAHHLAIQLQDTSESSTSTETATIYWMAAYGYN